MTALPQTQLFPYEVVVVDLETTDYKLPASVLSVGIVTIDKFGNIRKTYECILNPDLYDESHKPKNWRDSWILKQGTELTVKSCLGGETPSVVIGKVLALLKDKHVTSYKRTFDMDMFLDRDPWNVSCRGYECILEMASEHLGAWIPLEGRHRWINLREAVTRLFGEEVASEYRFHTALDDAMAAARVLVELTRQQKCRETD